MITDLTQSPAQWSADIDECLARMVDLRGVERQQQGRWRIELAQARHALWIEPCFDRDEPCLLLSCAVATAAPGQPLPFDLAARGLRHTADASVTRVAWTRDPGGSGRPSLVALAFLFLDGLDEPELASALREVGRLADSLDSGAASGA